MSAAAPRDHGGNMDAARARFGGRDWIDLSTGINRQPYPLPALPAHAWTALPTAAELATLGRAAAEAWGAPAPLLPLAGAQAAIQLIPRLPAGPGRDARVLGPTYNEHAASLRAAGWTVTEVGTLAALAGADLAVLVNPNNPDGRRHAPAALRALAAQVGRLVVDESFADPVPELSLLGEPLPPGLFVLRSFGKFYGLAGLRLGFVAAEAGELAALAEMAGPWPVSGAAIVTGCAALADRDWAAATTARLGAETLRADALARGAGWQLVGGGHLFRLYDTGPDETAAEPGQRPAEAAQERLARHAIWSRIFPWHPRWLRLGLPGNAQEWQRLAAALGGEV